MFLAELYQKPEQGHYSPGDDNSTIKLGDMRKGSRLTLGDLNRLRLSNDVRKVEHERKLEKVATQYKSPVEAAGLGVQYTKTFKKHPFNL